MTDIPIDVSFPHTYELRATIEVPQNPPMARYFYPGATDFGSDGVLVIVRPENGDEWLATFSFGHWYGHSGIYSLPGDQGTFLGVSDGVGYTVRASDPTEWEEVPILPIMSVLPVPEAGLLVLGSHTDIYGFDSRAAGWRSPRLAWDEVVITGIDGNVIRGTGYDLVEPDGARWSYDYTTGEVTHEGGPPPAPR